MVLLARNFEKVDIDFRRTPLSNSTISACAAPFRVEAVNPSSPSSDWKPRTQILRRLLSGWRLAAGCVSGRRAVLHLDLSLRLFCCA